MRYDLITMLPEQAFRPIGGRMTLEGGGGGKGSSPPPPPPPPEPPKQAAKTPVEADAARVRNKARMTAGMDTGPNTTFLTGPGGVDPTTLALGKSTLLGQ